MDGPLLELLGDDVSADTSRYLYLLFVETASNGRLADHRQ